MITLAPSRYIKIVILQRRIYSEIEIPKGKLPSLATSRRESSKKIGRPQTLFRYMVYCRESHSANRRPVRISDAHCPILEAIEFEGVSVIEF